MKRRPQKDVVRSEVVDLLFRVALKLVLPRSQERTVRRGIARAREARRIARFLSPEDR